MTARNHTWGTSDGWMANRAEQYARVDSMLSPPEEVSMDLLSTLAGLMMHQRYDGYHVIEVVRDYSVGQTLTVHIKRPGENGVEVVTLTIVN